MLHMWIHFYKATVSLSLCICELSSTLCVTYPSMKRSIISGYGIYLSREVPHFKVTFPICLLVLEDITLYNAGQGVYLVVKPLREAINGQGQPPILRSCEEWVLLYTLAVLYAIRFTKCHKTQRGQA